MKITAVTVAAILAATPACAAWTCYGRGPNWTCHGDSDEGSPPIGTYQNPFEDQPFQGDWSRPVHRGMYCAFGLWHHGWLQPWEDSPVIKPSCGNAVNQMPR